jgi:hypothetical protein
MTLRSISAHDQIEFGGKLIFFVGDLARLSPQFPFALRLSSISSLQASFMGH